MSGSKDALPQALGELAARILDTLRATDDEAARARVAVDVEQLRAIAIAADQQRGPGTPALFDVGRLARALGVFAEWLRAPTAVSESQARDAIAELQGVLQPLVGSTRPSDDAAERERYRQEARAALDDYFREHPIKPLKP